MQMGSFWSSLSQVKGTWPLQIQGLHGTNIQTPRKGGGGGGGGGVWLAKSDAI
jgi:hypothetical protein